MSYKVIERKLSKLFDEIEIHNRLICKKIAQVSDNPYDQKIWAASLYLSIIQIAENITILLRDSKKPVVIPGMVRDCIDAYINLLNVIKRYDVFIKGERKRLESSVKKLLEINIMDFSKEQLKEFSALLFEKKIALEELKEIAPVYISESKKRQGIGLEKHIGKFYELLSNQVHHNINSLVQRHMISGRGKYKISAAMTLDSRIIKINLHILLDVLIKSICEFDLFIRDFGPNNIKNIVLAIKKCIPHC